MLKSRQIILLTFLVSIFLYSCASDDSGDSNTSPDNPTPPTPPTTTSCTPSSKTLSFSVDGTDYSFSNAEYEIVNGDYHVTAEGTFNNASTFTLIIPTNDITTHTPTTYSNSDVSNTWSRFELKDDVTNGSGAGSNNGSQNYTVEILDNSNEIIEGTFTMFMIGLGGTSTNPLTIENGCFSASKASPIVVQPPVSGDLNDLSKNSWLIENVDTFTANNFLIEKKDPLNNNNYQTVVTASLDGTINPKVTITFAGDIDIAEGSYTVIYPALTGTLKTNEAYVTFDFMKDGTFYKKSVSNTTGTTLVIKKDANGYFNFQLKPSVTQAALFDTSPNITDNFAFNFSFNLDDKVDISDTFTSSWTLDRIGYSDTDTDYLNVSASGENGDNLSIKFYTYDLSDLAKTNVAVTKKTETEIFLDIKKGNPVPTGALIVLKSGGNTYKPDTTVDQIISLEIKNGEIIVEMDDIKLVGLSNSALTNTLNADINICK